MQPLGRLAPGSTEDPDSLCRGLYTRPQRPMCDSRPRAVLLSREGDWPKRHGDAHAGRENSRSVPFWFHPLLFAVFPAVSMLAANVDQVPVT